MTRPVPAIVEAAVDLKTIEREVQRKSVALQDADRLVEATEKQHSASQEAQARARVELGRELVRARAACAHGEWLPFLERAGIQQRSAWRYMELAGFVEAGSKLDTPTNVSNLDAPTFHEAGIDKRPRKSEQALLDTAPANDWRQEVEDRRITSLDIDRELSRLNLKIVSFAESCPSQARKQLAHELRQLADTIEEMP